MIYQDFCKCAIAHLDKAIEFIDQKDIIETEVIKVKGELVATVQKLTEIIKE